MNAVDFSQRNGTLGGGPGADFGTSDNVVDLPVHRNGSEIISCWQLTWRERLSLLFRGRIWLLVLATKTHAPVCLMTDEPFAVEKEEQHGDG